MNLVEAITNMFKNKVIDNLNFIFKGFLAGLLISLGGIAFLQVENKIIGSVLFSIGLIAVIIMEANLYTGKIGYATNLVKAKAAAMIMIANLITAFLVGLLFKSVYGEQLLWATKLTKSIGQVLFDSVLCGMCIYIAVECYKKTKSLIPVILGVVVFILAKGDHIIANAFYCAAGTVTWKGIGYLALTGIGNTVGSLLVRGLQIGINHEICQDR